MLNGQWSLVINHQLICFGILRGKNIFVGLQIMNKILIDKLLLLVLILTSCLVAEENGVLSRINVPLTIDLDIPIMTSMQFQGRIFYYDDNVYHNDTMIKLERTGKDIDSINQFIKLGQENMLEEFRSHCAEGLYKDGSAFVVHLLHKGAQNVPYKIQYKIVNNDRFLFIIEFTSEKRKDYMSMVIALFGNEYKLLYPSPCESCFFGSLSKINKLNVLPSNIHDGKYNNHMRLTVNNDDGFWNFNGYVIDCYDIRKGYSVIPANQNINEALDFLNHALNELDEISMEDFAKKYLTEKSQELFLKNIRKMPELTLNHFKSLFTNGIKIHYVIDANPMYIIFFTTVDGKKT